jgi:hypothetical protein
MTQTIMLEVLTRAPSLLEWLMLLLSAPWLLLLAKAGGASLALPPTNTRRAVSIHSMAGVLCLRSKQRSVDKERKTTTRFAAQRQQPLLLLRRAVSLEFEYDERVLALAGPQQNGAPTS